MVLTDDVFLRDDTKKGIFDSSDGNSDGLSLKLPLNNKCFEFQYVEISKNCQNFTRKTARSGFQITNKFIYF